MNNKCNSRFLKKKIQLFCEGQTENNYFNGMRAEPQFSFVHKPVDVAGGGYKKMFRAIKQMNNQGFLASVVLIDLDRAIKEPQEGKVLKDIINYINYQNKNGNIIFLILSNPDFDEFVLLHDLKYNSNKTQFIKAIGYNSISEFKSDEKIYSKFNSKNNKRSYENAIQRLNKNSYVKNRYRYNKSKFEFINLLEVNENNLVVKTSNIGDLFEIIHLLIK